MPVLFDPTRHAPLTAPAWDEAAARTAIAEIVAGTVAAFDPQHLWPGHPLDAPFPGGTAIAYVGAGGIIWALDTLKRAGACQIAVDFTPVLPRIEAEGRGWLGSAGLAVYPSLLMGDLGTKLLSMRVAPSAAHSDAVFACCADSLALPAQDLMWGLAGAMLAALWGLDATAEHRFADLYRRQAAALLSQLETIDGLWLWPCDLYGPREYAIGAVHGFAGNMLALLRGWPLLDARQRARVEAATLATLDATALRAAGLVNWPEQYGGTAAALCQFCHGAPGVVAAISAAPFAEPTLERLLRAGGALIWQAGPLAKGAGFCHGTGGNAHALLHLYRRTGAPVWLERARALGMAAIGQYREAQAQYGQLRHSLWTGDIGLAVVLWGLITARPQFPSFDGW